MTFWKHQINVKLFCLQAKQTDFGSLKPGRKWKKRQIYWKDIEVELRITGWVKPPSQRYDNGVPRAGLEVVHVSFKFLPKGWFSLVTSSLCSLHISHFWGEMSNWLIPGLIQFLQGRGQVIWTGKELIFVGSFLRIISLSKKVGAMSWESRAHWYML